MNVEYEFSSLSFIEIGNKAFQGNVEYKIIKIIEKKKEGFGFNYKVLLEPTK